MRATGISAIKPAIGPATPMSKTARRDGIGDNILIKAPNVPAGPIIGGVGTVFGPLLGALMVRSLGEAAKQFTGDVPGLDLVVYGVVLVLVIAFAPRGVAGILAQLRRWLMPSAKKAGEAVHG